MAKNKILIEDISRLLNIHRNSVSYKLNKGSFYIDEAEMIQETFFPKSNMKVLFKRNELTENREVV